jgi:glycosyltransferase involved in cell wall biosynthesis
VIFSSNAAKSDAEKFYPTFADKYRVLHFVPGMWDLGDMPDFVLLKEKYQITEPYFIVPNQFWVHKNHTVILDTLAFLKKQGHNLTVVATGNTSDYRQPGYFNVLHKKIQYFDISENFRAVGVVPYKDLLQLMIHAVAVVNPSLFEGWSTSVEEAKALDLNIILSDISVHREQNPEKGIFFPPHDSERLAHILVECLQKNSTNSGKWQLPKISEKMNGQQKIFAQEYEKIVLDSIGNPFPTQ